MSVIDRARELRKQIEAGASTMRDEKAVQFAELFPAWAGNGFSYTIGDRVRYEGVPYKALQTHDSQELWNPKAAPSLWSEVLAGQSGTDIGEWQQPDSTNPYNRGDRVRFNGKVYESLIDGNVWSPAAYPQSWQEVTE